MKKTVEQFLKCLLIILLFTSCEAEKESVQQTNGIIARKFSLRDPKVRSNAKLMSAIGAVRQMKMVTAATDSGSERLIYDANSGLIFDDQKGLYTQKDNLKSYTFPVMNTTANQKIKNICFNEKTNGSYDAYIVEYDITKQQALSMTDAQKENVQKNFFTLMKDGVQTSVLRITCIDVVLTTTTEIAVPIDHGDLTGNFGYTNATTTTVTIASTCVVSYPDFTPPNGTAPVTPPDTNGPATGPANGASTGSDNGIITGLNAEDITNGLSDGETFAYNYTEFIQGLNASQIEIFTNSGLVNCLVANHWAADCKQYVLWMINYISTHPNMDVAEQAMIDSMVNNNGYSGDSPYSDDDPENGPYNGPKRLIPQQIVTSSGDVINVTFGTTASDNQNANNQVADDLVNAITFALEKANSVLSASNKITSIHIAATTNGAHSANSNHIRGTAVDISRINGEKIINLGANNQVTALQQAFDDYAGIRENFGPSIKHKTFPDGSVNLNWPVGGHRDHIHISVQNN